MMKNLKKGMQIKFFASKQVYELITENRYRKYSRYGYKNRDERKSYLLSDIEEQHIRSVYDPIKNRQIAKRKHKGDAMEWFYES